MAASGAASGAGSGTAATGLSGGTGVTTGTGRDAYQTSAPATAATATPP
ncbi:MAG: hypothetical protein HZT43_11260 [Exiguobacterium profundum]|nr:MAG: hypothetical protein HZT43_11260 [Exiguobacterium profundum]